MEKKEKTKAEAKTKKIPKKGQDKKIIAEAKKEIRIGTRGRFFEGVITKKFPKRIVLEFERMIYIKKYKRYAKLKTKIHARLPEFMEEKIKVGDFVKVQECRPLSKIIHFVVIQKIKDSSEVGK